MRVLLASCQAPFFQGGGELHAQALEDALRRADHEVGSLRLPFKFSPEKDIERLMAFCDEYDLERPNGKYIDRLISLQFPCWGIAHPQHMVWIMHQHRKAYELYNPKVDSEQVGVLRQKIHDFDNRHLRQAHCLWANSARVAQRLKQFNNLVATPLYHPPPLAEQFVTQDEWGYIFLPSRLETLKRQELAIRAAALLRCPVKILIGGEGGQQAFYAQLIEQLNLHDRVKLIGKFSDSEKISLYAHSLAVLFPPYDEDLGYVTLEAMYSGKPVITCTDSGGALEFVRHGETGWVVPPLPEAIAESIEAAWQHKHRSEEMGLTGKQDILSRNLSWDSVVEALCA